MDYFVYEHTIGTPSYVDTEMEDLEEILANLHCTADEAEKLIRQWVPDTDRYGNKRKVYVHRLKERRG